MNGIHEVVGSIPISSTMKIDGPASLGWPFFLGMPEAPCSCLDSFGNLFSGLLSS